MLRRVVEAAKNVIKFEEEVKIEKSSVKEECGENKKRRTEATYPSFGSGDRRASLALASGVVSDLGRGMGLGFDAPIWRMGGARKFW